MYSTFLTHHHPWDTTNLSNVGWKEVHEQKISNKLADFHVDSSTWDTSNHCMDDVSSSCSVHRLPLHPVYQLSVNWSGHMINLKLIWVHWRSTHHATGHQASITSFHPVDCTRPSLPETSSNTVNPDQTMKPTFQSINVLEMRLRRLQDSLLSEAHRHMSSINHTKLKRLFWLLQKTKEFCQYN
jgi:hypothetical protein